MRTDRWRFLHAGLAVLLMEAGWSSTAEAHGVWGHVHVTGWAAENLPPGELRDFLSDPEVMNALLFGAAYTDSGYSIEQRKVIPLLGASDEEIQIGHEYSEHTHWEPFINAMIAWIRNNDPPPFTSLESKKRAAFVMGAASHGLQDEIFDSTFLFQSMHYDNHDQEAADPGTDYLLNEQGYLRFAPPKYVPMDAVREVYHDLGLDVSEAIIQKGVDTVGDFYLNPSYRVIFTTVIANGDGNPKNIPWVKEHYLDPDVPGSLLAEIMPTARHQLALWERLHGRYDPNHAVVYAFPSAPRRLRSHLNDLPDSWVTLVFGAGVKIASASSTWTDAAGTAVPYTQQGTRWGAEFPRLMRLQPSAPLVPGAWYDAGMNSGAMLINGGAVTEPFSFHFQVQCTPEHLNDCGDLGSIPIPALDGSGPPPGLWPAQPTPGEGDAGAGDAGAGESDAGAGDGDAPGHGDGDGDGAGDGDGVGDADGAGDDAGDGDTSGSGNADGAGAGESSSGSNGSNGKSSSGCAVSRQSGSGLMSAVFLALTFVLPRRRKKRASQRACEQ
jgi:hypothetical protein